VHALPFADRQRHNIRDRDRPAGVFIATQIDLNSPHEARQMRQFYRRGTLADRITISPVIAEGDVRFFRLVDQ
jgi:hypothetical protein